MDRRADSYSMWADACAMLERAERLQRQFFRPVGLAQRPTWEPPVDLFESEHALVIVVALPGVRAQHVQLVLDAGDLIVTGERYLPAQAAGAAISRMEIPAGRFERQIPLPAGRFEIVERARADGCLTLVLRRL